MTDNYYREPKGSTEATQVMASDDVRAAQQAAAQAEADDAAARRAQERADRDRALGRVQRSDAPDPVAPSYVKPTTDKFPGSLGLFLLRLVTGAIMGIHGFQKLTDMGATTSFFSSLGLPYANYLAWATGIGEVLAAVALVFGVLTRLAGLGTAIIAIGALALVKWGKQNPFQSGQPGFTGELELLLAAVGLALFFLGAGRWSIDGSVRTSRKKAKLER
ncbi:DoxX family protein [Luteococcus peritonei]|uniref:DoxX family protein n=1 Tax=Luteococcus peritonei TaxID=88874 RepID=A0ABW4RVK2_9ACTN